MGISQQIEHILNKYSQFVDPSDITFTFKKARSEVQQEDTNLPFLEKSKQLKSEQEQKAQIFQKQYAKEVQEAI